MTLVALRTPGQLQVSIGSHANGLSATNSTIVQSLGSTGGQVTDVISKWLSKSESKSVLLKSG